MRGQRGSLVQCCLYVLLLKDPTKVLLPAGRAGQSFASLPVGTVAEEAEVDAAGDDDDIGAAGEAAPQVPYIEAGPGAGPAEDSGLAPGAGDYEGATLLRGGKNQVHATGNDDALSSDGDDDYHPQLGTAFGMAADSSTDDEGPAPGVPTRKSVAEYMDAEDDDDESEGERYEVPAGGADGDGGDGGDSDSNSDIDLGFGAAFVGGAHAPAGAAKFMALPAGSLKRGGLSASTRSSHSIVMSQSARWLHDGTTDKAAAEAMIRSPLVEQGDFLIRESSRQRIDNSRLSYTLSARNGPGVVHARLTQNVEKGMGGLLNCASVMPACLHPCLLLVGFEDHPSVAGMGASCNRDTRRCPLCSSAKLRDLLLPSSHLPRWGYAALLRRATQVCGRPSFAPRESMWTKMVCRTINILTSSKESGWCIISL